MQQLMERMRDPALMPPVAKLIGFRIEEVERGKCVVAMEAGPQHSNFAPLYNTRGQLP